MRSIFITGTDTSVGKTVVTGLLGKYLKDNGVKVTTQKWIQTGCIDVSEDVRDHLRLMGESGEDGSMGARMPYILKYPASPHLAAKLDGVKIDVDRIKSALDELCCDNDIVLVEGAGGILVPVNEKVLTIDIVKDLAMPVILVAENRVGAINQTLLTVEALKRRDMNLLGIVFNRLSPQGDDTILEDNKHIIEKISGVKVLGELEYKSCYDNDHGGFGPIGENIMKAIR